MDRMSPKIRSSSPGELAGQGRNAGQSPSGTLTRPDANRVVRQIGWMQGRRTAAYLDGMLRSSDAADADLSRNPKGRRPFAHRRRRSSSMMPPASYPPRFWSATKIPGVAAASGLVRVPKQLWAIVNLDSLQERPSLDCFSRKS